MIPVDFEVKVADLQKPKDHEQIRGMTSVSRLEIVGISKSNTRPSKKQRFFSRGFQALAIGIFHRHGSNPQSPGAFLGGVKCLRGG